MKLSAVLIAKNAEGHIADAISSVDFADEVVVVDNGSTDRTVEIATYMKARVYPFQGSDFSKIRNFGLRKAVNEWILYIDADERVTEELEESITPTINNKDSRIAAYKVLRKNFYFGNHEWPYIEHIVRLFRRSSLAGWKGELHESPEIKGEVGELEGFLLHYTHRDLTSMLAKTIVWSKIEAELRFKAGHPKMSWWRFLRVMITAFFDSYIRQGGWKAGTVGLVESMYQAFSIFVTYGRLWELQQKNA